MTDVEKGPTTGMPDEPAPLKAKAKKKNAPKTLQEILGDVLSYLYKCPINGYITWNCEDRSTNKW